MAHWQQEEAAETADNIAKATKENPAVAAATLEEVRQEERRRAKERLRGAPVVDPDAPVTSLEEAKAKLGDNWAKVGTPTEKARLHEGKLLRAKKRDYLNTEHCTTAKAVLDSVQEEGKEIMQYRHMRCHAYGSAGY